MNMRIVTLIALLLSVCSSMLAQDLSLQRGENQDLGVLLGEKLDHNGLVINPTPQELQLHGSTLDVSKGVVLKGRSVEYAQELDFLNLSSRGVALRIERDVNLPSRYGVRLIPGAYRLDITRKGIDIRAHDDAGVFYAVQTLRQIVDSDVATGGKLPCLTINDWPSLPCRGVVEGFYGTPWSHATRLSLINFYGRYKMNYYIYGPKDDPYHSSPYWREPYPANEAENIRQLVETCRRNRVNFVWAIHPGQDIRWDEEDYGNLLHKFEYMYDLGVRAFAIHFDDISGEGANPVHQIALLNRLNEEFVASRGDIAPLIVCPTDYTRLWANPTPQGSLVQYGNTLHPSVDIFWTGDAVCSDLTEETVAWVGERVQRPILFWWNYPVTDYVRHILLQAPVYGLSSTMTADKVRGIVSNPMEHGEASKLALYSVADYAWNTRAYNPVDSWERALEVMAADVKEAYRTFAIHSCDTETGYRRIEGWETETFTIDTYTPHLAAQLIAECEAIEAVPAQMEACDNKDLLAELRPWLVEFGKLGARCRRAIETLELYNDARYNDFWNAYVDNLMTPDEVEAYNAHSSGTMKLQPFYRNLMDDMAARFYEQLSGNKAAVYEATGTYASLQAPQAKFMFDDDTTTYYHSGAGQRTDHYVAVDMGFVQEVSHVHILQGRNSIDDVDYYDHAILEYSLDGDVWKALSDTLVGVYDITWRGDAVEARYVRLRKLPSTKTNWLALRSFKINPVDKSLYHIDRNPYTALASSSTVRVEVPRGATRCVLLLGAINQASNPTCSLFTADGELLQKIDIRSSLLEVDVTDVTTLHIEGVDTIFEVIPIQ
ncbi:MAG: beta-N-acetylglucosaminidase domain-containing protein [Bacteroidaceae bacterium]|nr:beta-N-acetylglucosaminidase domain-containing protein [Bacteroidaceae bacterium]